MGRPVVLPDCNIGHDLEHGQDALLLERGDALEIAERLEQLIDDPELRERLAAGARRFALEQLNWKDNSIALGRFLNRIDNERSAGARARAAGGVAVASRALETARRAKAAARRRLKARLAPDGRRSERAATRPPRRSRTPTCGRCATSIEDKFALEPIGYGTVRDYADSTETSARPRGRQRGHEEPAALLDAEGDPRQRPAPAGACSRSAPVSRWSRGCSRGSATR